MNELKDLLEKRKRIKQKKPKFDMQDAHKKGRLKTKWKKPRGIDSKMRLRLRGYNKSVEPGYGSAKEVRGLDKTGLMPVWVSALKDIESIDKEKQGIIIKSTVGKKKRVGLINKAKETGIRILNIKDTEKYIKDIEEAMKKRKEARSKKEKKKTEKKEDKKEKKEDKLAEKVLSEEEKVAADKKEKDKLLTKKEA